MVAQDGCNVKILLRNDDILIIKYKEAKAVYDYLRPEENRNLHSLTIYVSPWHGFFAVDGKAEGLYPDEVNGKEQNRHYGPVEKAKHFGYWFKNFTKEIVSTSVWKMVRDGVQLSDYKLGKVKDEKMPQKESNEKHYPSVTFVITEAQYTKVNAFIEKTKNACKDQNQRSDCEFQMLENNCLQFSQKVFAEAFPGQEYSPFFQLPSVGSVVQNALRQSFLKWSSYFNLQNWDAFATRLYEQKAFIFMKVSQNLRVPQDSSERSFNPFNDFGAFDHLHKQNYVVLSGELDSGPITKTMA